MDCVKVSKEPKSGGIDFEFENEHVYECGADWFLNQKSSDEYFRHLRDKNWFTTEIEEKLLKLIDFKPSEERRF